MTLHFDVTPVPGLNWQEVNGVRITRVVDDAGRSGSGAVPEDSAAPADLMYNPWAVNRRMAMRFAYDGPVGPAAYPNPRVVPVPLRLATPTARALRLLEGAVVCEVAVPEQPLVTVEDPARLVGLSVEGLGGAKVTVLEVQAAAKDGGTTVRVRTEAPAPWLAQRRMNPWGPIWPEQTRPTGPAHRVKAFDATGKPVLPSLTTGGIPSSEDGATLTTVTSLTFTGTAPAKLVFVGPRPTLVEVPFKMENVPLP
jgi:hypothetical protein